MNYAEIAKQFAEYLYKRPRPAKAAALTWSIVRKAVPGANADAKANFDNAFTEFRLPIGRNERHGGSRREFIEAVHNLSKAAKKWTGASAGGKLADRGIGISVDAKRGTLVVESIELSPVHDPDATRVVRGFFEALQARKFQAAWEHIDSSLQESAWNNDYGSFERGYRPFFVGYRRLQLFVIEATPGSAKIDVLYEEDQYPPDMDSLADLRRLKVSEVKAFCEVLERLKEELHNLGADEDKLSELPLRHLFSSDAGITVPWFAGVSSKAIYKKYGKPTNPTVFQRMRRFHLNQEGALWLINQIDRISF